MALAVGACGGDDTVMGGDDTSASTRGSGGADDATGAATGGTTGADDLATGGADSGSATNSSTGMGSGVDSTGNSSATTNGSADSGTADGGSDTGNGGGPGVVPGRYPGVDVGLCTPPGIEQYCYSGAPATYLEGECAPGVQECVALDLDLGEWGPCQGETLPALEVCDDLDNDCDGEVDEEQGFTMCGIGLCEHQVPNCLAGLPVVCDPFEGATPEICDGIDNDCDNDIDEGLGGETSSCGIGQCEHDVTGCEGGNVPECDPFFGATPEICDGIDNDCDGSTDEGLGNLQCGCGECDHTVPSCINGFPQVCDPFEGASGEICDGLDNDCDCATDEDQGTWTCGANECEVTVPQCVGGVPQPQNTCQPIPGGPEICGNGIDDNCDGVAPPCAESFLVGTDTTVRPIDVIWGVDSSGSMSGEMALVEQEINDFAAILAASPSSTQLHLIADRGVESFEICVDPPLGGAGCADNPAQGFWQYDTNGNTNGAEMIHSSNALGRIMQQSPTWLGRLQPNSYVAFIVTTDDDGDDPSWVAPNDSSELDDCGTGFIVDNTNANICRWDAPGALDYTSLAFDFAGFGGFTTFMANFFPGSAPGTDWAFFPIIGETGTAVLTGADDVYEFGCAPGCQCVELAEEYVKLAEFTDTQDSMFSICEPDWDPFLTTLANDIVSGVPNDLYDLAGNPPGNCALIDPATITVIVNGIPLAPADWVYDNVACQLQVVNNVPVVGDNVVIVYDNF
jgi:hypothetical protein